MENKKFKKMVKRFIDRRLNEQLSKTRRRGHILYYIIGICADIHNLKVVQISYKHTVLQDARIHCH
jgi:hypothetical protein